MPNILDHIGNTRLLPLNHIGRMTGARIALKMEAENPTGSMKDRMALAMIDAAEADGRLKAHGTVIEYTGGSTGISLALVCAVKGYHCHIVTADAFAPEKLAHMQALGAELTVLQSDNGRQTEKLVKDMIARAESIAAATGGMLTHQMQNRDQLVAYTKMADEIWAQTNGRLDALVQAVGTAASIRGMATRLRQLKPDIQIIAVEPAESAVLSGGATGAHKIDGIGAGYVTPLWQEGLADSIEPVSTADAKAMAARLAKEEGILPGPSTGANVTAALRVAERMEEGAEIVTVMCDAGVKYLKE
ncbi:PLP-dependent cysteine synthase family protein [Dongia rigui]|uniref:Cysteine synthase family protein n=1 Tax=Dongia rigui TaxID=940149 RepID=A0ABU5DWE8_9PROT|nr:cysteine synthase family protein [Dongia rigui]MDY0871599.1 cysteine synthase family protein [Dongia rigui]